MLDPQPLDHADQVPIFGVKLPDTLLVALVALDADFVAAGDLMSVVLEVFGYFFGGVVIEEADRAFRGATGYRRGR